MRPLILDRLRSAPSTDPLFSLCRTAADEIERLMGELEGARRALEALTMINSDLLEALSERRKAANAALEAMYGGTVVGVSSTDTVG